MISDSQVVNDVLWTEKYRPTSLDEMALEPENRKLLESYFAQGAIPHLILSGPAGSGKTTVSRIIVNTLDCAVLSLNASSDRGIDVVRGKIRDFVGAMTKRRWNIVFLDESDAMTADAQTSMRNTIEAYSEKARFLMTCNYLHRIIGPIQSRCQVLSFGRPPLKERARILQRVLKAEGISAAPSHIIEYAEKYPDMRAMLWATQKGVLTAGNGETLPPASEAGPIDGEQLFANLLSKQFTPFLQLSKSSDFDCTQLLRELFYSIPDDHVRAGFLRHVIGHGVHESGFTADPNVLFLAVIAEAQEGL